MHLTFLLSQSSRPCDDPNNCHLMSIIHDFTGSTGVIGSNAEDSWRGFWATLMKSGTMSGLAQLPRSLEDAILALKAFGGRRGPITVSPATVKLPSSFDSNNNGPFNRLVST